MARLRTALLLLLPALAWADPAPPARVLEDFQAYAPGSIPIADWESRNGDPKKEYRVAAEPGGNRYLEAFDARHSVQFFKDVGWRLSDHPYLSWRWRVETFPAGADERDVNDSAAGVYVVFPRKFFIPETIKYVWSTKAPVGTVIRRRKNFPIFVVRSGPVADGGWITETRNVKEDYRKIFGHDPSDPVGIGFLTDSNDTKTEARAGYDDLVALRAGPDPKGTVPPTRASSSAPPPPAAKPAPAAPPPPTAR